MDKVIVNRIKAIDKCHYTSDLEWPWTVISTMLSWHVIVNYVIRQHY